MSGSHHQLGVRPPLLATTYLLSPEAPIKQNPTTIIQVCISLLLSVAERKSCCVLATRRDPITFETGDERKDPKSIRWGKVQAVEDGNSEVNDVTTAVGLQSHEKSRRVQRSQDNTYMPLFQPHLCYTLLSCLPSMHQKFTPRLKGGRGGMLTKLICCFKHYNCIILYFITDSYLL